MNAGEAKLKNTNSKIKLANASTLCSVLGAKTRALKLAGRSLSPSAEVSVGCVM
jgi:hypothetical protein